jgi:hypothetical protein
MNDFVINLTNLRKKISTPDSFKETLNDLKDLKDSIISYLNMLNFLKTKIPFGKDQFSLKLEFVWLDTIKDSKITSNDINYEIYSNLFNLSICNNFIAKLTDPEKEEETKLKDVIKNLEFSAGIIDKIKKELPTLMPEKDIPIDLSDKYLDFVNKKKLFFYYFYFYLILLMIFKAWEYIISKSTILFA